MDNGASSYRRFLNGDKEGIVEIIRDYKDDLTLYLNTYVRNISTAEELMEEVFVKLVTKKPRFSGKSSFKTWLYAIGRNIAIDHLRHISKLSGTPIEDFPHLTDGEETAEHTYIKQENKQILHNAMKKLRPQYRQVLYLIFFEELDNEQTAQVMRKTKRQIENLVYHAKQSLKAELNKEGFVYEEL